MEKVLMRLLYGLLGIALLFINVLYFVTMPQRVNDYFLAHLENLYGNKKCNEELKGFIRHLADEYGVDNTSFVVRCANTNFMQHASYANAGVMSCSLSWLPISCHRYILFLSKDYLDELSLEQRTFLIVHELMHIKNNDPASLMYVIACLYLLMISLLIMIYHTSILFNKMYNFHKYYTLLVLIGSLWALSLGIELIRGAYSRFFEKRADIQACTYLGTSQGGISWLNYYHKTYNRTLLSSGLFSTHPSNQERIVYLEKLQNTFV